MQKNSEQMHFRTFEIVAVTLAVSVVSAGLIYWNKIGNDRSEIVGPEISIQWLESGGVDSAPVIEESPSVKNTSQKFNSPEDEIAARAVGEEIISLREDAIQVFKGGKENQLVAKVYATPMYYLDKTDSTYKEIDTSIHKISDSAKANPSIEFDEYIDAGNYKATWFKDKPWNYKFYSGNSWIQYEALFEESDSLDIKVDVTKTGIKETITLKNNTAPTKLQWNVKRSGSGIITPSPTAVDANGKEVKVVSYQLGDVLTYQVDVSKAEFPIFVDPTSSINTTNDGYIYNDYTTVYATAHDATTGWHQHASINVGQSASGEYRVYRGFLTFAIPAMANVSSCVLHLDGTANWSNVDFELYIVSSTYSDPIVNEDFDLVGATTWNDTWNSSSYSNDDNALTFNSTGLLSILASQGNTLKLALRSKEDVANSAPTDNELVKFTSGGNAYLTIIYQPLNSFRIKSGLAVKGPLHVKVANTYDTGVTCITGTDCYSGSCYVDADGDRYAPSTGTKTCKTVSALTGTDCDDANAAIYPGTSTGCASYCNTDGSVTNVPNDTDPNGACSETTCTNYIYGWSSTSCKLYSGSSSHNGMCNGSGSCYTTVADSCSGAGAQSGSATCGSSGCLKSCPATGLATSYDTVGEVCYTSAQNSCSANYVCNSTGTCEPYNANCTNTSTRHWDATYCWIAGAQGQSCNTTCAAFNGNSPVNSCNWGVGSGSSTVCDYFYPGLYRWDGCAGPKKRTVPGFPDYCYSYQSGCDSSIYSCAATGDGYDWRICACDPTPCSCTPGSSAGSEYYSDCYGIYLYYNCNCSTYTGSTFYDEQYCPECGCTPDTYAYSDMNGNGYWCSYYYNCDCSVYEYACD